MIVIQRQDSAGLFEPFRLGDISLKHRVVMAPMTRLRAGKDDGVPSEWAEEYYSSRATDGGLILSEANLTIKRWQSLALSLKPGTNTHSTSRVAIPGVNPVVYAPSNNHDPTPGALQPGLKVIDQTDLDQVSKSVPRVPRMPLELDLMALKSMLRMDIFWTSSIDNRIRFPIGILKSVTSVIPPPKVGLRISPFGTYQGMREPIGEASGPIKTFSRLLKKLYEEILDFGYIHALEPRSTGDDDQPDDKLGLKNSVGPLRQIVLKHGSQFNVAGGYTPASAKVHGEKYNELIAFGRSFTSNPDLVERIKKDLPLTKYDRLTFYTQDKAGCLGWPTYQKQDIASSAAEAKIDVEASVVKIAA
ncbi:artemisinic aldehyde Delta(11(13)) reductase [Kwoniella mangroviensis CBS 8886]|nr:artemisinic aldehyde Delta(11(13)) reductase [Kwoniella mangroviensis CBS 8886]